MSMKSKIHFRSRRLYVNAGISYPQCYCGSVLLDYNKCLLIMTSNLEEVTCKHCKKLCSRYWRID
jgi:hypothetical protein